ncbi:PID-CTERM protein-sorting domain-containing protein [Hymenobacter sp. BT559]|uniref:PID-CTERM protein-sorting domain-containing protein n=1 Tax=Hymenobacter sp. BT559 TaxID=2795729 RepID=UPI0018EAFF9C|nr:hypothetical protein [Hymenobacter sp. BT559]MBJ6145879.1 hypothetical protein [Hymenobacter sp. BT559]
MRKFIFTVVILITFTGLLSSVVRAQAPTTTGPAPTTPAPAAVPLDGGSSLLLASGVAYGLRRLRQRRQRA